MSRRKISPPIKRLIGSKWVSKLKCDKTYHARVVVLGYSQIPSVDFTTYFAPMVNNITFHLMLSRKWIKNLSTRIIDVEIAFYTENLKMKSTWKHQQDMPNATMKLKKMKYLFLTREYMV